MPPEPPAILFVPVAEAHYPLLAEWLSRPHVRQWWGDSEDELGYIRDMVEGRDTTRPFLMVLDGRRIGYIQMWHVDDHRSDSWLKDNPWLAVLPPRTVGVDLSIGEPDCLGRGVGPAALKAFVAMLRAEGFSDIIIDPDQANLRAVRAYEKAGFRPIPELQGKTGDVLIMRHEPARTAT